MRKGRAKPDNLASAKAIAGYNVAEKHVGLHSSSQGNITQVAVKAGTRSVMTVGSDKHGIFYDLDAKEALANMKGHHKKINDVAVHSAKNIAASGSNDNTVCVWDLSTGDRIQEIKVLFLLPFYILFPTSATLLL